MAHALDGPRLKVVRAREHIEALHLHIGTFFKSEPYSISREFDAQSSQHRFHIHVVNEMPIHRFAALVGDAVHNLRSALDHLAWKLAEDFSGHVVKDTGTQFPIFNTEAGWNQRSRTRLHRIGPGATAVIRSLQPFQDKEPLVHPLWFVSELDNGDKHRELALTAVAVKGYGHRLHHPKDHTGIFDLTLNVDDIHDGMELATLTILPAGSQVYVEPRFEFQVALTWPTVPVTEPRLAIPSFLDFLADRVDGVLNCFNPFYAAGDYDDSVVIPDPLAPFHLTPPRPLPRSDEQHEEWSRRQKERIDDEAARVWDERAKPLKDPDDPDFVRLKGSDLFGALRVAAAAGFKLGTDAFGERLEETRGELNPPEDWWSSP